MKKVILLALCIPITAAAKEYTIEAPGGVGDIESLTNALVDINKKILAERNNSKVWLKPGVYNLRGVSMSTGSGTGHLSIKDLNWGLIAGLGDGPEDTILLGGGKEDGLGVLCVSGNNSGWMTISNLTVTGGWSSGNGGGICGNGTTRYSHLIVSNNYANGTNGGGGGGCMRGRAEYCLFSNNRVGGSRYGGAFWTDGGGGQKADFVQGAWHCTFSNNVSGSQGGALSLKGKCVDCTFVGNTAAAGGAIVCGGVKWTWYENRFTNSTEILDCKFIGNTLSAWGEGSAVYCTSSSLGVPISNCVFTANDTLELDTGGSSVVYKGNLTGCIITNNISGTKFLYNCNLSRCYVANNQGKGAHGKIDGVSSDQVHAYTNSNCIFLNNLQKNYGHITSGKVVVNCSYIGNISNDGGNYGGICKKCRMWNTLLFDNWIDEGRPSESARDIRAYDKTDGNLPLVMTNCLFATCDSYVKIDANGYVTNDGVANTRKVANMRFVDAANGDYTPKTSSPMYDAGCQDPWLLSLVGDKDLAGNQRVFGEYIDIGAYECQNLRPGFMLILK